MIDIFGNPLEGPPPSTNGNFVRGLKQSGHQLVGTGWGLLGLAGAGLDAQGLKDYGLEHAQAAFNRSDALSKPTDQLEGIDSFGSGVDYLTHGLGYVAGQALPAVVSGGAGSVVGKMAVKRGIQGMSKEAAELAVSKAAQRGAIAGAGAASYGQEAGSMYPEAVQEGHDEPGRIAAYAIPAAALDIIPEMNLARKLFPFANQAAKSAVKPAGIMRRVATTGLEQAAMEAPTEAAQTFIERAGERKSLNDKEAWSDYVNSAALGALGGGAIGGITGAIAPGSSVLPGSNPAPEAKGMAPEQGTLDLLGGSGGTPPMDLGPIGPEDRRSIPTTYSDTTNQPDLFGQQHQYDPNLQGVSQNMVSAQDVSNAIVPPQGPTQQIEIPGQAQPSNGQIVSPVQGPDTRTAYGIAAQKQQRGQLLTPYETYLVNNPPATPKIEIAQDRTVPLPSKVAEGVHNTSSEFGYKMTPKRFGVAAAAEEAHMQGTLDEGTYNQIHTLLAESKLAKAKAVLFDATQQPKEIQNGVPTEVPVKQEAPIPTQVRQEAPVVNASANVAQEGRQGKGKPGLLTPTPPAQVKASVPVKAVAPVEASVPAQTVAPVQASAPAKASTPVKAKPVKKATAKVEQEEELPPVDKAKAKEVYEDNHQEGEPTYDELSKEDQAIWNDKVAYGEASITEYDKFQRQLKNNAIKEHRAKAVADSERESDVPSIKGTISLPVKHKVPPNMLKHIKVDMPIMEEDGTVTMEPRSAKAALESLDKQEQAYKALRDCIG